MKYLIVLLGILGTASAFSNETILKNKMDLVIDEFKQTLLEDADNVTFSPKVCGTAGCKLDVIQNGMINGDVFFSEEVNQNNGASKIRMDIYSKLTNSGNHITAICLQNDECKYFYSEGILNAEIAYENGEFKTERKKRNGAVRVLQWAGGSLLLERATRVFSGVNDSIDQAAGRAYDWARNESKEMSDNWKEMNRQREMYEVKINKNGGNRDGNRGSGGGRSGGVSNAERQNNRSRF